MLQPNNNKKISLFVPNLAGGGVERVMVTLANGFAERGYQVDLVLSKAEGVFINSVDNRVQIINLKAKRVLFSLLPLANYLRREKPSAMLSGPKHANIVAIFAKAIARTSTRLVVSEHTMLSESVRQGERGRGKIIPKLVRYMYPYADAVVAVSRGAADDLKKIIGPKIGKINVIYNPIITPKLLSEAEVPLSHSWFGPDQPPVVLGVGRLTEQKDFITLIKAFSLARKSRPLRLLILGDGENRASLESLIDSLNLTKDVSMPGFSANPYQYMRESAVYVLSSKWEGFGNVLVEALVSGAKVISTDCHSGPAEILENGKWGRLVPVGDFKALSINILEAIDDDKDLKPYKGTAALPLDEVLNKYLETLVPVRDVCN